MEQPQAELETPVDDIDTKLSGLAIKSGKTPKKRQPSLPMNKLSIHPTPYMTLQSPTFNHCAFNAPPNNERSYLLENRQRQHERGQRLLNALHIIEVRVSSAQSKAESRKLWKEAARLKKKIAESLRQEQLITLRLTDIQNDDCSRNPYWQAQSVGLVPYQTSWSPITLPMMPPMYGGPVSPLMPLSQGLYHPSPVVPSGLAILDGRAVKAIPV